ncbi:MAG TPA: AI-2E family transporter [Anditalea sp.]|nr:AI-2E family transporter [Anditalea sp.]
MANLGINKINGILILTLALITIFYIGEPFLKPITLAFFFATLMKPVSNLMERWGVGRVIASLLCTIIVFLCVSGLIFLIMKQASQFADDLPKMAEEFQDFIPEIQNKIANSTGITASQQSQFFEEQSDGMSSGLQVYVQGILQNLLTTLGHFFLTMVYLFLFLIHRTKFKKVILQYIPKNNQDNGNKVISEAATVSHHYLWGRIKVMTILGIMYLITFLAFDIRYAILFTVLGSIITIIPYIGPLLSGVLPVAFALVEGNDTQFMLLFATVILIIQLIESYILEPWIIGNEVSLTPLFIIIAIIIGGMLWGILGMILFVPLFAICKIIFDHIDKLRPLGFLMSNVDDASVSHKLKKEKEYLS